MKTAYSNIYKRTALKTGNGSYPPETAGESGREVKYCKRQAGPIFPHSSLATPLFMKLYRRCNTRLRATHNSMTVL